MQQGEMPKILVVDDEPINVELLEAYLTGEYNILTAYNGEEALEKVKSEHPDLILLDIMMPGMDGYEICRILKNDSLTQFIPIVMVTALS
ncbi:MAG: CheY chemotaxis protein or a CheY-like REC (receiver) domain, partial [Candidatus Methanocomedens sp.]